VVWDAKAAVARFRGRARGPAPRGHTVRCRVVGRSIVNFVPLLKRMSGHDWQHGRCHVVRLYLYIGTYVRYRGLSYKSVRWVSVCPWTSRTVGRCTACKAFQVAKDDDHEQNPTNYTPLQSVSSQIRNIGFISCIHVTWRIWNLNQVQCIVYPIDGDVAYVVKCWREPLASLRLCAAVIYRVWL